ncbi:KilA-N domain-containing protein [Massilia aquatica]|uniref:KilA-N domain-containing protein n=1 Tax=Massilia aquatica TaxID=2609000 RepID=A0ABX0LYW7_9BURK|nr:KilA-N domain-containing protein [Massilia aquatica]NHZ40085.1 KilA-N domain-containing protein [Massilia aquatica]
MSGRQPHELLAGAAGQHPAHSAGAVTIITAEYEGKGYSFRADGWFNATAAAKKFAKRPGDWLKQEETKEYMAALAEQISNCDPESLLETKRGRREGGTWMHPKLVTPFARWLSVRFAVWCDLQIDRILRGEIELPQLNEQLSNRHDRDPLYHSVVGIVRGTGMLYGHAYRIVNAVAGTKHFDEITLGKLDATIPPAQRLGTGTGTPSDYARVNKGMIEIYGEPSQLALDLHDPPAGDIK